MEVSKAVVLCLIVYQFFVSLIHLLERWENEQLARQRETVFLLQQLQVQNMVFLQSKLCKKKRTKRRYWVKERSKDWWERIVQRYFTEDDWLKNFRMSSSTFKFICLRLEQHLKSSKSLVWKPMSVEKKVAVALYKLASCDEYRVVANQFGTHKCMVHKCLYQFCEALIAEFRSDYITVPNDVEAQEIADGFEGMCGIPNVIGAIDGTHIPVLPPTVGYRDFINRKGWPSYNMMAVVDHLYRFRYATCQHVGCTHDACVLKDSNLFKYADTLLPERKKTIDGMDIPYFLVGDPAYPLLPWLMKGYKGNLTPEQESFNVYLNSGRVVVENAFGQLKARFRCLLKRIDINHSFVPNVVLACLILHNITETRKDSFQQKWLEAVQQAELEFPQPQPRSARDLDDLNVSLIRDTVSNYMTSIHSGDLGYHK